MMDQSEHTPASVLQARWNNLLRYRRACLDHDTLDTVHDLRVATRRLRSALQLFAPLCPGHHVERILSSVRRLTRGVGELRNIDEAILFFQQECRRTDDCPQLFGSLLDSLYRRRAAESTVVRKLLKRLDDDEIRDFMDRCERRLSRTGRNRSALKDTPPLAVYLSETSITLFSTVDHLLPRALAPDAVETRHRLRIAIKHWRYFLEIVADISGKEYGLILENLKQYQSVLGTLNDLAVFSALAADYGLTEAERERFSAVAAAGTVRNFTTFAEMMQQQPLRYQFLF